MLDARVLRTSVLASSRFRAIVLAAAVVTGIVSEPTSAFAQSDKWQVDAAPLYLSAAEQSGKISVANHDVPLFMDFGDVADTLAGAFACTSKRGGTGGAHLPTSTSSGSQPTRLSPHRSSRDPSTVLLSWT